ncbi:contactin-2-like isoform X2 [Acropora muricata]|uniref:contactin-2-like isoform X2 n=1 Tax=Acropora muricata TaxID=159855 RepID=UPI0034E3B90D
MKAVCPVRGSRSKICRVMLFYIVPLLCVFHFKLRSADGCRRATNDTYQPTVELKIIEFPNENILPIGYNVTIACISNASNAYESNHLPFWIQFYRNHISRALHDCGGRNQNLDGRVSKVCELFIQNATKEDSANYTCWALTRRQCVFRKIELQFRAPSPPKITNTPPREVYAASGSLVNLTCKATGVPLPVVTWFKDGILMPKEKLTGEKADSQITFPAVTSTDQGNYSCEARNAVGWERSSGTSLFLAQRPSITFHPKNIRVYMEEKLFIASFTCKATGNPEPVITWLKNNSTKANGTSILAGSISTLILALHGGEKTLGNYSCVAKNLAGQAYSKEGTLEILAASLLSPNFGGGASDVFSFYVHPKNTSTESGDLAVFMCAAEGPLVPEIIWLKNGKANAVEGSIIISKGIHGATSELRIYPVERKHSGTYSCQAKSRSVKVSSREATLFIKGDSSSLSSSCKLWISVAVVAPFLLFGFGIATIYVYNKSKKAELYFNKQAYEVQDLSFQEIHQTSTSQRGQQLAKEMELTATTLKKTQMGVENEAYMQNPL